MESADLTEFSFWGWRNAEVAEVAGVAEVVYGVRGGVEVFELYAPSIPIIL